MKPTSGKTLARVPERHGWVLLRIKGSHHVYGKPGVPLRLSIPMHGDKPLKIGLLSHSMKVAGLEENELQ